MTEDVRELRVHVDRPVAAVQSVATDPRLIPRWAPGLGHAVRQDGDDWYVEQADGWARVSFVAPGTPGVLDHDVVTAAGPTVHVRLRAEPSDGGCDVVFRLERQPGMSDEDLERDAALVAADLASLRDLVEAGPPEV